MLSGNYQPLCDNFGNPLEVKIGPVTMEKSILAVDSLRENQVVVLTESQVTELRNSGRWMF